MSGGMGTDSGAKAEPASGAAAPDSAPPVLQRKRRSWLPVVAVIVVVVVIASALGVGYAVGGWFKTATSKCGVTTKGTLLGEGSTLVAPLMDQWASSYWGGGVLTYDSVGSSSGISSITNKISDFGASDAPLTASQRSAAPGLLTIPESAGGVVPIYNLAGITLNFTGSVLAQIFDGNITNWNNTPLQTLNPHTKLPVATIDPIYRTGGSGTTFIFTSFLTLEDHHWANAYGKGLNWPTNISVGAGQTGNGGVATTVSTTPDSIGYVDLNYAITAGSGVGIGSVQNPKGNFIRATVANTESALIDSNVTLPAGSGDWYNVSLLNAPGGQDYPITSLTYVLVYQDLNTYTGSNTYTLQKAENLVDFLTWAVTLGQNYSALLSYVPLPSFITTHDLSTIDSMTFGGSSIPVCVPST